MPDGDRCCRDKLDAAINEQAQAFIGGELLARVIATLGDVCQCELDKADPHVINIRSPLGHAQTRTGDV